MENAFMLPNQEKKADNYMNCCLSQLKDELPFLKWYKKKFFLWNESINIIYPNEENMVMVPNHEKNGDYYVNPCLSQSKDKLQF